MAVRDFQPVPVGELPTASEYNRLQRVAQGTMNLVAPGLDLSEIGGAFRPEGPTRLFAKITAVDTSGPLPKYSAKEQMQDKDGATLDRPGGLTFSPSYLPLYEFNHSSTVAVGTIVEAIQGNGLFWLFSAAGVGPDVLTNYVQEGDISLADQHLGRGLKAADGFVVTFPRSPPYEHPHWNDRLDVVMLQGAFINNKATIHIDSGNHGPLDANGGVSVSINGILYFPETSTNLQPFGSLPPNALDRNSISIEPFVLTGSTAGATLIFHLGGSGGTVVMGGPFPFVLTPGTHGDGPATGNAGAVTAGIFIADKQYQIHEESSGGNPIYYGMSGTIAASRDVIVKGGIVTGMGPAQGATGTFTTVDGKTVTVLGGIVVSIV